MGYVEYETYLKRHCALEKRGQIHIPWNSISVCVAHSQNHVPAMMLPHEHNTERTYYPNINYGLYQRNHHTWAYTVCCALTSTVFFLKICGSFHSLATAAFYNTRYHAVYTSEFPNTTKTSETLFLPTKYDVLILPKTINIIIKTRQPQISTRHFHSQYLIIPPSVFVSHKQSCQQLWAWAWIIITGYTPPCTPVTDYSYPYMPFIHDKRWSMMTVDVLICKQSITSICLILYFVWRFIWPNTLC